MIKKKDSLKAAILSLSLLTVMAGAAVSPALGGISAYFKDVNPLFIKMILTVPALFILFTNLVFAPLTRIFTNRTLAILALLLYMAGGCMGGFVNNIYLLLFFRAVLGVSVGILMPMSTSLISYYFERHEQEKLMGYSAAMNQLGGVIVIVLSGILVSISWRLSFLVYFIGVISFVLTLFYMPDEKMIPKEGSAPSSKLNKDKLSGSSILRFWNYYLAIGFMMITFYMLPTNFAVIATAEKSFSPAVIGILMAFQTGSGFVMGMMYSRIKSVFGGSVKYLSVAGFIGGFSLLYFCSGFFLNLVAIILVGVGLGVAVPMLNSEVSRRSDRTEIAAVLGIMSAALNLGQFSAPLVSAAISSIFGMHDLRSPYIQAVAFGVIQIIIYAGTKISHSKHKDNEG